MNGLFWVIWAATSAGMAKLLAVAENSVHGQAYSRPVLQQIRGVHNACLVGYPLATLWLLGLTGPQLAWSTGWSRVPMIGWMAWGLGALGLSLLIASSARYLMYRPPASQTAVTSRIVNVQGRCAESLVGEGRAKWLARLPRNQQFTLEVSERTFVLDRLPAAWDGLSIVHFSDLHFRGSVTRRFFEEVMAEAANLRGDIIAFTGDLLDKRELITWIEPTLGRLSAPLGCYFVLGNHDWYLPNLAAIRQTLADRGWQDVAGRMVRLERDGVPLLIAGNELPWMGVAPAFAAADRDVCKLVLSHSPDQIVWAREQGIDLLLAGHTHGGQIRLPVLGPVYAPSRFSCRYASGIFHEPPTLMCVSRGISGREPIRYNCRPEVMKITLRKK